CLCETVLGRRRRDANDFTAPFVPLRAGDDPIAKQLILPGGFVEELAAAVLGLPGCLEQKQAVIGIGRIEAPTHRLARQGIEILVRVVAEEGKSKTAFALERPVA